MYIVNPDDLGANPDVVRGRGAQVPGPLMGKDRVHNLVVKLRVGDGNSKSFGSSF